MTVYLYDQFGAGQSARPAQGDFDRFTVEHYREELEAVRRRLDIESFVLFGHSWGGMLALEYVLHYPENVSKLILSGALHDVSDAIEVMREARQEDLTDEELETMRGYEASHDFDNPEYQELIEKVYAERMFWGERPIWADNAEVNMDVYGLMWGPTEFALAETARLRDWSVKERLSEIETPTLVIVGEHDEIGPEISQDIADRIPDSRLEVIENASHYSFWDNPEQYNDAVEPFLRQ